MISTAQNNMKTAICISGAPRFVKEGHALFSKFIKGFEDMDVFVHVWEKIEGGMHSAITRTDSVVEIRDLYNIASMVEEPQRYDIGPGGPVSTNEFVHWSMFYSIWKANDLKRQYEQQNNFRYDCVIRTRFDCALLEDVDVSQHSLTDVKVPFIHRNGVIPEWFNFSSSNNMDFYSDVWKKMIDYKAYGKVMMTSGEELLTHHLKSNNVDFSTINTRVSLIRNEGAGWTSVNNLPI